MAKKSTKKPAGENPLPVAKLLHPEAVVKVDVLELEFRKLNEIGELLWLPQGLSESEKNIRILRALKLYEDLKPGSGAEGMLAAQMVGTHSAALECLRRAAIPEQTFEGRNMALTHAQKLMSLYTKQLAALDKHRGKGQQKVIVEHVNVEAGGQAIVGNVEASGRSQSKTSTNVGEPDQIENAPDVPVPDMQPTNAVARKKR